MSYFKILAVRALKTFCEFLVSAFLTVSVATWGDLWEAVMVALPGAVFAALISVLTNIIDPHVTALPEIDVTSIPAHTAEVKDATVESSVTAADVSDPPQEDGIDGTSGSEGMPKEDQAVETASNAPDLN